jgi:hypothetical protein
MAGDSLDVTARTYHTENGVGHAEGETYAVTDRALAETLRGIGFVSIAGWTDAGPAAPPPTLTALEPTTAVLGSPSLILHVRGTGFTSAAVIVFAGHAEPTTVVSPTEVTTGINMSVWHGPDTVPVTVMNGGGVASNALPFTFTAVAARRR